MGFTIAFMGLIVGSFGVFCLTAEKVPATYSECKDLYTLADAVNKRNLGWHKVLVCPEDSPAVKQKGFAFAAKEN